MTRIWMINKERSFEETKFEYHIKSEEGKEKFHLPTMRDQKWKKRTESEIGGERTIRRGKKHQIWVTYQKVGDGSLAKFNYRRPIRDQRWKEMSELEWVHKDWHQKWKKRSELEWVHKDWHQKWKKRSELEERHQKWGLEEVPKCFFSIIFAAAASWKIIYHFLGKEFAALLKFSKSQKMIDRVMQFLPVLFAVVVSSQFVWFVGSSFLFFFWEP